jgi:phospholipase/lecithinase/hemolysin
VNGSITREESREVYVSRIQRYFVDAVHPTAEGNHLVSMLLLDHLINAGYSTDEETPVTNSLSR